MVKLPWGFSPANAARQAGDVINPFNGSHDYDVLSDKSFAGGWRNPQGVNQAQSTNDWAAQQSAKFDSPSGGNGGNADGSNLVDEHDVFKGKKPPQSLFDDGVHPNTDGHELIFKTLLPEFNRLIDKS